MSYKKFIRITRNGLIVKKDPTFDFRWHILDDCFEKWTYPKGTLDFKALTFGYSSVVTRKEYQIFLTDKDRIVFDLLLSADIEYLMKNKQFMREFEISYRFLKSLGLDERC